jgi:hypothetical protein
MRRCRFFQHKIDECYLFDLGSIGPKFTWWWPKFNNGARIYERLDRAMSNDKWRLKYPSAVVKTLTRVNFSDHHPLLVCFKGVNLISKERPFRFERQIGVTKLFFSMNSKVQVS